MLGKEVQSGDRETSQPPALPARARKGAIAGGVLAIACAFLPGTARATEGATSLYILGTGGPGTAVMPPLEGIYLDKIVYVYDGKARADREFPVNGNVVLGLEATVVANFETLLVVPSTDFLGGTLALGVTLPIGAPMLKASALLEGPGGNTLSASVRDSTLTIGDPVPTAMLGWHGEKLHFQLSTMVNVPVGHYREDRIANLSLHRWAVDGSAALSFHDPASGWDLSVKAGYTWNGENDYTGYDSGDEFHLEGAIEKSLSPAFSLGVQGYWFKQVSDDDGFLGPFRGEVAGVGVTAATTVTMGGKPATFRGRIMEEFDATNRLEGTSFWLDFTYPIAMRLPG